MARSAGLTPADIAFLDQLRARYPDKLTRLRDGFYDIKDKTGKKVPFRMNAHQDAFICGRHGLDIELKGRQLGYTTVIQLDYLDDCLFIPDLSVGVIAHNQADAQAFFRDKIKYAYDNLPAPFRKVRSSQLDSADTLKFNNGSTIRVGTSLRSGTLQRLHVSEFGKLCAKYPDRAQEVVTGAFNTVALGQKIAVESTAEGRSGEFFRMVKMARDRAAAGHDLTPMDFRFHFTAWFEGHEYELPDEIAATVVETAEMTTYFAKVEQLTGIKLNRRKRAWYIKKAEQQGEKMKQEYPSTPDEAFEKAVEGAYFSVQMLKLRARGGICKIPILNIEVYTTWDLGINDSMCITFWQDVGPERRAIDYYENSGEGFAHYAQVLRDKPYMYSVHYMPHDAAHRRLGVTAKSAQEAAQEVGIRPVYVLPRIATESNGIEASRNLLPQVWIDEERCARLVDCLDNYRKEWNDKLGVFRDQPLHDEYSHGYKSFESAAIRPAAFGMDDEDDGRSDGRDRNQHTGY